MTPSTNENDNTVQVSSLGSKILLREYSINDTQMSKGTHFVNHVLIPYFKDIFEDLSERSQD